MACILSRAAFQLVSDPSFSAVWTAWALKAGEWLLGPCGLHEESWLQTAMATASQRPPDTCKIPPAHFEGPLEGRGPF